MHLLALAPRPRQRWDSWRPTRGSHFASNLNLLQVCARSRKRDGHLSGSTRLYLIDSKRFVQRFASNFETHRRQYSCRVQLQHQIQLIKLPEIVGMWEHRVRPPHTSYTKVFECGDSNMLMQSSSPSSPSTNSVSWINSSLGQRLLLVRSSDRQWLQLQLQNQLRNTCQNSIERNLLSWCSENPGRTIPSTIASALRTLSLPP